ncbi:hypothetical protein [Clostridium tyrobutyricum]|uniref:hypothetical protein n=1 Tax=Clostridium tyrobutyricum TaxID=1519 RepID=UPI00073D3F8D|nr:hypothetical protein [Clostridium tyrobutyricum]
MELLKEIEKELICFLEPYKKIYEKELFDFHILINNDNILEMRGEYQESYDYIAKMFGIDIENEVLNKDKSNNRKVSNAKMLIINVNPELNEILIPNIFLPDFMKHQGIGKKIISKIFKLGEKYNYKLFIVNMVPSFYNILLNRGALQCDEYYDAVRITKDTILE